MRPLQVKVRVKTTSSTHALQTRRNRDGTGKQTPRTRRHCPIRVKVGRTQKQIPLKALLMQSPSQVTSQVKLASPSKEKQAGDVLRTQQLVSLKDSTLSLMKSSTQRKSWIYTQA